MRAAVTRIGRLILDWQAGGQTLALLACRSGVWTTDLQAIRDGQRETIRFGTADAIVTAIDPFLWHIDPVLASAYGSPFAPEGGLPPAWPFAYAPSRDVDRPRDVGGVRGHDTGKRGSGCTRSVATRPRA